MTFRGLKNCLEATGTLGRSLQVLSNCGESTMGEVETRGEVLLDALPRLDRRWMVGGG